MRRARDGHSVVITFMANLKMTAIQIVAIAMMLAQGPAASPPAPSLDYSVFKERVQPIFLQKRTGAVPKRNTSGMLRTD
jgi:hypothetical protein